MRTLVACLVTALVLILQGNSHAVPRSKPWHKLSTAGKHRELHKAKRHYTFACRNGRRGAQRFHCAFLTWNRGALKRVHIAMRPRYQTGDFYAATLIADRIWPGHGAWARQCARSEGGWGRFVMNQQGSGAGGNLQFMSGTFYAYVGSAFASARRRGFGLPSSAMTWTSPLGQAITAAYMSSIGQRGHWVGASC